MATFVIVCVLLCVCVSGILSYRIIGLAWYPNLCCCSAAWCPGVCLSVGPRWLLFPFPASVCALGESGGGGGGAATDKTGTKDS